MSREGISLQEVLDGWDGYQRGLLHAVASLSPPHLAWRGAPHLRSVGEIAEHIGGGRVRWLHQVLGLGGASFARHLETWAPRESAVADGAELVRRLEATWELIEEALAQWSLEDLRLTVRQEYRGDTYAIPRQWVLWRILTHDVHHGGELSIALGMQGLAVPELGDQGGHLAAVPRAGSVQSGE